jgi:bifunctional non-homologous end joining protein LigD
MAGGQQQPHSPFTAGTSPEASGTHWVRPELVAEIAFAEWTHHERLRQPRFEGLRPDKQPHECRREQTRPTGAMVNRQATVNRAVSGGKAMPLEEYQAKRDFAKTSEPAGSGDKPHRQPIFVVQEHHASRLHYDFRLEAEGVLKSWAVPKGPSLDPVDKRLAVQVEDHPLSYASFTGVIPAGQYGAGRVNIWDNGTYDNLLASKPKGSTVAEGIAAGRLEVILHGKKLKGRFTLIRMAGRRHGSKSNWLLIKGKDEYAQPSTASAKAKSVARVTKPPARKKASP